MLSKRRLLPFACAIVLAFGPGPLCTADANGDVPEIPARAVKPEAFAVEPWKVDSLATGDLNRDGKPDAAIIVSVGEGMAADARKLIVALYKKDGYEKVIESDKATMLGCGPSGSTPTVQIHRGTVIVGHYCGARERYEYLHKYQLRNGRWILIGYTASAYDTLDLDSKQYVDVNTLTGEVSSNRSSGKGSVSERLLELWAAPISTDEPSPSDWGAPAVRLASDDKKSVVTLQAVHSRNKLFIKAQLENEKALSGDHVRLTDGKGHVIQPDTSRSTIYGYVVNSYDFSSNPLKELIAGNANDEHVLRLSVNVKTSDGVALTTEGKKRPGAIFLSKSKGAPDLKDVDVRDGDPVHPFFTYQEL